MGLPQSAIQSRETRCRFRKGYHHLRRSVVADHSGPREHSRTEPRFITMGKALGNKLLVVVHTERGDNIRIISARRANSRERKFYEEIPQIGSAIDGKQLRFLASDTRKVRASLCARGERRDPGARCRQSIPHFEGSEFFPAKNHSAASLGTGPVTVATSLPLTSACRAVASAKAGPPTSGTPQPPLFRITENN